MAEITMADLMEIITIQEGRVTIRDDRALHGSHPARKDKTKTDLIILMAGKAAQAAHKHSVIMAGKATRKIRTIPISNSLRTVFQI